MNLDRLRERVEGFLEEVARERYTLARTPLRGAGLGAIYLRSADLFSRDRISQVQRAVSESSGTEERRARFLLEFLARGRAVCASAVELDQRLTFQVFGSLTLDERRITFREARPLLAASGDAALRLRVEEARLDALEEEEHVVQVLLDRQRAEYEDLGYGSFVTTCEVLSGSDLHGLAREGERFLDDTDALHRELLAWYLPRLAGVSLEEASVADLLRLHSAPEYEELFPAGDGYREEEGMLREAGLDPLAGRRIRVEEHTALAGGRPARCIPLQVPGEIRLLTAAQRGRGAHGARLNALGRALHHAYTSPDLPMEFRWLGDRAVPRAMGETFGGLLDERAFLHDRFHLARERTGDYLRLAALLFLLRLRGSIGLFLVSVSWERGDADGLRERYVETMTRASGVRYDAREALWAMRLPIEIAWQLRAQQLAALFATDLRERFDDDWYRNPRSGAALVDLFSCGQRYLATELAVQLTSLPPSFQPVLDRVREMTA